MQVNTVLGILYQGFKGSSQSLQYSDLDIVNSLTKSYNFNLFNRLASYRIYPKGKVQPGSPKDDIGLQGLENGGFNKLNSSNQYVTATLDDFSHVVSDLIKFIEKANDIDTMTLEMLARAYAPSKVHNNN